MVATGQRPLNGRDERSVVAPGGSGDNFSPSGGFVAGDADLVAVGIAEVCAVVVGVIVRPETGCSLARAAVLNRGGMTLVNLVPMGSHKSDHAAITGAGGVIVERTTDHEQCMRLSWRHPSGHQWRFGEFLFVAQGCENGRVKREGSVEVRDTKGDVGVHERLPLWAAKGLAMENL
ncbi:MAG: hypothetical protein ACI89J_001339 [Hyphomicrobiaceae bacterium]|jgi:hypothetical protein